MYEFSIARLSFSEGRPLANGLFYSIIILQIVFG